MNSQPSTQINLQPLANSIKECRIKRDLLKTQLADNRKSHRIAIDDLEVLEDVQTIMQTVAETIQQNAHKKIADIVTHSLQAVFGVAYSFKIEFAKKRNKTEAKLLFIKDGQELNPLESSGGGIIDVAAFALRLSNLILTRPILSKIVILDEPFKYVSQNHREFIRQMLESLSDKLDVQFIFVTHITELETGKIVGVI